MLFRSKIFSFFLIIMLGFSFSSSKASVLNEDSPRTLKIQVPQAMDGIDPRNRNVTTPMTAGWIATQYQGYLGMMAPGKTTVTLPGIAESWSYNTNRTQWVFTLREGVKFHDGTKIDAKAVKYSVEANVLAKNNLDNMSLAAHSVIAYYGLDISFPASDPNGNGRVIIFSGDWFPDPMFEWDVSGMWNYFTLLPYDSHGSYTDSTIICQQRLAEYFQRPISAGPYMIKEWVQATYVLLERFDDWFGWGKSFTGSDGKDYSFPTKENAFSFLNFSHVNDNSLAIEYLKEGKLDVLPVLGVDEAAWNEINDTKGFSAFFVPTLAVDRIAMNIQGDYPTFYGGQGNFPLSQIWFRQAASHAINRTKQEGITHQGKGLSRTTWFPSWIEENSPNLDTSNYYNFNQGIKAAETLLDEAGYLPLGFPVEPTNRFGWGDFANETSIDGIEQTAGRHFQLIGVDNTEWMVNRANAIKQNLEQVGIFVDLQLSDWDTYIGKLYSGNPGLMYNTTGPQPDPNFKGPEWDFSLSGAGGNYETPWDWIGYNSFVYWLFYGRATHSWFNEKYEIGLAKATGGKPGSGYLGIDPPPDMPENGYIPPEWSNEDSQFIEGCEEAGYELAEELPYIPLTWYRFLYVINDNLENFIPNYQMQFFLAYSYWSKPQTTPAFEYGLIMVSLIILVVISPVYLRKCRKDNS